MLKPTSFYVVRHGETEWNVKKLLQGHGDSPLTAAGQEQIHSLARQLDEVKFDQVFSSDLLRAQRTAELLTMEKQIAINTTRLLRERAFGKYEGRSRQEFETENRALIDRYRKLTAADQKKFKYAPDMESDEEVTARLLVFIRETAVAYPSKSVLVVSHGGVLRVLLNHLGYTIQSGRGVVGNGAYIHLLSDGVEFELRNTQGIALENH